MAQIQTRTRPVRLLLAALAGLALTATAAHAELAISNAWAPPEAKTGVNVPMYMSFKNTGAADALLRVRCPVANFTEKRTIDLGEGAPSAREVKAIPIPAGQTVLTAESSFIVLLQTTQPFAGGETFSCKLAFQSGESREVEVTVKSP
jgi:copper(I)-binding protein